MGRSGGQHNRVSSRFFLTRRRAKAKTPEETAHEEALCLLGDVEIPSQKKIEKEIKKFKSQLEEQGSLDKETEKVILNQLEVLASRPLTDFELLILNERLIWIYKAEFGLLSEKEKRELRDEFSLVDGEIYENLEKYYNFSDAGAIYVLKKFIPLIRLSGQSMESLRLYLEDQFNINMSELSDEELYQKISQPLFRIIQNKEELIEQELLQFVGADNLSQLLTTIALSRNNNATSECEKIVKENFSWAQGLSEVANRRAPHLPVVISNESLAIANTEVYGRAAGISYPVPGHSGIRVPVLIHSLGKSKIADLEEGDQRFVEKRIKHTMVHEMIHDTQDILYFYKSTIFSENDEDANLAMRWIEGLTEGLTILRLFNNEAFSYEERDFQGIYANEVYAIYRLLDTAGIPKSEYEDRIHYLNSIPPDHCISALAGWRQEDEGETKRAFAELMKEEEDKKSYIEDKVFK